ncbi:hypothetical protein A8B98_22110 [Hymenobacter sp. UV11]|nr:hypothetical protein A8B98_22110 [Hymenobacter sp. UV11]
MPFKLTVGKVARCEWSCGIQGRSTVLTWCSRHARHFAAFQQASRTSAGRQAAMDQSPEQRIKQPKTKLLEQKYFHTR